VLLNCLTYVCLLLIRGGGEVRMLNILIHYEKYKYCAIMLKYFSSTTTSSSAELCSTLELVLSCALCHNIISSNRMIGPRSWC